MGFAHDPLNRILKHVKFDVLIPYVLIVGVSIGTALVLLRSNGDILATLAFLSCIVVVVATFYRVDWGFYIFFGMVLLFDQFLNKMPFGIPITDRFGYFLNLKQNPFLPPFSAGVMNPLEIQMVMILLAWFIAISARKSTKIRGAPFWGFAVLLLIDIGFSTARGLLSGGEFLVSLWEIRALIYFLLLYFLVPQVIQSRRQIYVLLWIFIVMVAIKALQGDWRLAALGFKFDGYSVLTNHEDPMFMADVFILLIGLTMFGVKIKQRTAILWLLPVLLLGFYAGQRRAAYAGFFIAIAMFVAMLSGKEKVRFFRKVLPLLIVVGVYTAVFWNNEGRLGEPIQLVKSGFSDTRKGAGDRFDSNLYRDFERFDLAATVQSSPAVGIGFGKKYLMPIPLVDLGFTLQDWIPHDEILWVMVKTGALGFFIFWLFMDALVFQAGYLGKTVKDPFLRALAFLIATMVVNQMVVSYFDLQLTYYRDMVVLGTFCGLLPAIKALAKTEDARPSESKGNSTPPLETVEAQGGEQVRI